MDPGEPDRRVSLRGGPLSEKVEGPVVLDGLIEGKLPDEPGAEEVLREWLDFAASLKLKFNLEMDGNSFSILADDKPIPAEALGPRPEERIADALGQLVKALPTEQGRRIFSTLRSAEYLAGCEVQTIYGLGPDGTVQRSERTLQAETTPPPRRLTRREKVRRAAVGIVVAAVILAVTSLFVPYRKVYDYVAGRVAPFNTNELKVETGGFKDYFTVERKAAPGWEGIVVVTLRRTRAFPLNESDLEKLLARRGQSLSARLVVEALARGYVRCEYYDRKGEFLDFSIHRIAGLREKETVELSLSMPDRRVARIVITY